MSGIVGIKKMIGRVIKKLFSSKKEVRNLPRIEPFYHDFGKIKDKYCERTEYIIGTTKNMRVLHFGFLDSPFLEKKINDKGLLHELIKEDAEFLYGIDVNENDLSIYRNLLNDFNNMIFDIQDDSVNLPSELNKNYDLILFSEVLEHMPDPGKACKRLYEIAQLNNARVIITVPNAFNNLCFNYALQGVEFIHPDHFHYYSPLTLTNLLKYAGFKNIDISFYTADLTKPEEGITKFGIIANAS